MEDINPVVTKKEESEIQEKSLLNELFGIIELSGF